MTPGEIDRMLVVVEQAVREETRGALLLHGPQITPLPPPNDLDSEERVITALLDGAATFEQLRALTPDDFYKPLHRAIFGAAGKLAAAGTPITVPAVVEAMFEAGATGALDEDVARLRDEIPFTVDLRQHVASVRDAARCRRISAFLRTLDGDLRLRHINAEQALDRMRRASGTGRTTP